MKVILSVITLTFAIACSVSGSTRNVGSGQTYTTPAQAAAVAQPGDTILIHAGNYPGNYYISNLNGTANAWIVIMGVSRQTVIMNAGAEGLHFSDINYLKIQDITFRGQTANSLNIDDAGTISTPARHIIVNNCDFRDMGAQGNNDFLKLSGLDSFEISNCHFLKAAAGGSGIDMVGCHYGQVHHCTFDSMGSNSVQMKGGTRYIRIENNTFRNGGQRSLNLGGSTGLSFFRPIDATYEAADIKVYANVFIKGLAPIAYVGSERVDVANNTFYMPEKWVIRILQETVDTSRFVPCRNGMFRNNIIYTSSAVTTHVNIGPNTAPNTFLFSHNLWYNSSNPSASTPSLPTTELSSITGQDPLFTASEDFKLKAASPAIGSGTPITGLPKDMQGFIFKNTPSRGAYEFDNGADIKSEMKRDALMIYPNPATSSFSIHGAEIVLGLSIINAMGQSVKQIAECNSNLNISMENLPPGIYRLIITLANGDALVKSLVKI